MKVFRYGDNIDTDVIIPARYLNAHSPGELAAHCMEDIDPAFAKAVRPGDVIVAGENFGCGSSREHAPMAILACGVKFVIAKSFARIFYRNALNIGLTPLESPEAAAALLDGAELFSCEAGGRIKAGKTYYQAAAVPEFLRGVSEDGGLLSAIKKRGTL
ncbi:MAG: 3-isopropylmalate dehydratase small subunit [Oscillospiraceae bacterium]|jgi:3-isopropylmalate/(R)-2-methylmalate dehydratase small subunit|nr:3-isopropylmalate dehydratase small subunit [Oscillospiraceae bacterium]